MSTSLGIFTKSDSFEHTSSNNVDPINQGPVCSLGFCFALFGLFSHCFELDLVLFYYCSLIVWTCYLIVLLLFFHRLNLLFRCSLIIWTCSFIVLFYCLDLFLDVQKREPMANISSPSKGRYAFYGNLMDFFIQESTQGNFTYVMLLG